MKRNIKEAVDSARSQNDSFIDRFAEKYAPGLAAKRAEARYNRQMSTLRLAALNAATSSWKGGSSSRNSTKGWNTYTSDPDNQNNGELQVMRDRSRDLIRNNSLASGAINNVKTFVVGDKGPTLNSQLDGSFLGLSDGDTEAREKQIQMEWNLYFNNCEFDIERTSSGPDFMSHLIYSWFSSGDVFCVRSYKKRKGSPYGTKWQSIESDLCSNPDFIGDGETADPKRYPGAKGPVYAGVEKDPETKEPLAYYFQNKFSNSNTIRKDLKWTRVSAFDRSGRKNVIHLYIKDRPMQSRGVPYLAPILDSMKQLDRYSDAELMAAVTSGLFSVFVTSPEGRQMSPIATSTQSESKDESIEMGYGNIISLKEGEKVESQEPGRPNQNFDPFYQSIVKQIGVSLGQPMEVLLKHFQSSYSAARAAMLEAWRYFQTIRGFVERNWLFYVYDIFFEEAVSLSRVMAPGYLTGDLGVRRVWTAKKWVWPARGMIRPEVEIKALTQAEEAGYMTKEEGTAQLNGGDYNRNYTQRFKEAQKERKINKLNEPETVNET